MVKVLFFLLACVLATGYAARTSRIHFGRRITQQEVESTFSFVVGLRMHNRVTNRGSSCTGTLISEDTVVTAAHCLCGGNSVAIRVYYKTTSLREGSYVEAVSVQRDPKYQCGKKAFQTPADVGRVKLAKRISGVKPIPLECRLPVPGREQVGLIGFGKDENDKSGILKIGFRKTSDCSPRLGSGSTICVDASVTGIDRTAPGDSGGPLVVRKSGGYALIGAVSGRAGNDFTFFPMKSACSWINK